ncbi:TIGR00153 family protein [Thalassotalea ponticola]|uniref:TIGR00153 family protein n=1 Tax=Thalassotalea ponticola TaxID=1523392 RepID=UPI0025B4AE59|nr:TIGR00153 family protein [Thalassotalea ponticola]MDN3651756.1 TIGR00153 family protein [Thalassotalea ponticola]
MSGNNILGVFAKSPIKPLEKHIRKVHECTSHLPDFFKACAEENWEKAEDIRKTISSLEKEADKLKREIRNELPSGIFMPVQRTDVLELVSQQDKIANKAKDIAGRFLGRKMEAPASLLADFDAYVSRCLDAVKQAAKAINELDDLLEAGFRGREVDLVENMIEKLAKIEDDTDRMQVELRRNLLAIEDQLNPVDVIFLYQIIEWVGDLADLAERVGARLEIMLAR